MLNWNGRKVLALGALLCVAMLAGCGHKLVAHNGESTVNLYTDRQQFDKVTQMKSQGGAGALLGGLGESMLAKKIPDNTPVKVVSTDDEGAVVQITQGPDAGVQGYVSKDNLD